MADHIHQLDQLVAALPEIYQPIFDHPELSSGASRSSEDRLAAITRIYQTLERAAGRPLCVLDLGCAQGFFSLSLARLGATVVGIDFQDSNIAVCQALAAEHPGMSAVFQRGYIEHTIEQMSGGQYDLVLGLSVFHHLVHKSGLTRVQHWLALLADKTLAGIYEMARASEPPEWAVSQPQNPRELLNGYIFVHELAQYGTHLSAVHRPLYVASNRYWLADNEAEALPLFN